MVNYSGIDELFAFKLHPCGKENFELSMNPWITTIIIIEYLLLNLIFCSLYFKCWVQTDYWSRVKCGWNPSTSGDVDIDRCCQTLTHSFIPSLGAQTCPCSVLSSLNYPQILRLVMLRCYIIKPISNKSK